MLINLVDLNDHAVGNSDNHIDHDGHEVDLIMNNYDNIC